MNMQDTNLILKIKSHYNQLTRAEKKVADYVMANQRDVIYMSITDLAEACAIGDTSVYRFCRTMELKGYQEFKMRLSLCLPADENQREEGKNKEQDLAQMAEMVMNLHIQAIRETNMLLEREQFEKIVQMLEESRRVYFFGVGSSLLTAQEASTKFLRVTDKVLCIADNHMQAMAAATATNQDLIIIISYSGSTKDNIDVARVAKQVGVKLACISHFQKSPLTAYCDAVLLSGSREGPLEGGSMAGRVGQLYLVDLLYQEYYRRNYKSCKKNNEKTSIAVLEKLY